MKIIKRAPYGRFPTRWKPLRFKRADYLKLKKLRKRHGPVYRKGPRGTYRPTIGETSLEQRAAPVEETGSASLEERILFKTLTQRRIPFDFQSSMFGGRAQLGGIVADFIFWEPRIVIRVQGTLWHKGAEPEARDAIQKAKLENQHFEVWDIWDWQIREKEIYDDWIRRHIGRMM